MSDWMTDTLPYICSSFGMVYIMEDEQGQVQAKALLCLLTIRKM